MQHRCVTHLYGIPLLSKVTMRTKLTFTINGIYICNMELNFSLDKIENAAKQFLSFVSDHKVFAFNGEMGAGKTTFIKALCTQLGVEENISSPTYSIIQQYKTKNGKTIYHIDLYRMKDEEEVLQAGVEDCLYSNNICFVEWPEKASSIFPANKVEVFLQPIENDQRKMIINLQL